MALKRGDAARRDLDNRNMETPTERLQNASAETTERLQNAYDQPMKDYRVRLPENWWQELKRRGAAEGLKPSQLVRRLIAEYLGRVG